MCCLHLSMWVPTSAKAEEDPGYLPPLLSALLPSDSLSLPSNLFISHLFTFSYIILAIFLISYFIYIFLCSILKNTFQYHLSTIKEVYWRLLSVIKWVHNFCLWETLKFDYRVDLLITSFPLLCGRSFLSFLRRLLTLLPPQQGPSSPQPSRSRVRMWRGGGFSQRSPERHTQGTIPACTAAVRSCLHACLTLRICRGLWHNELRYRFPSSIFAFQKMLRPNVGIRK